MDKPIGLIIREIIDKKDLEIVDVARKMGMTRQNVYQTFGRKKVNEGQLAKWALALDVSVDDLRSVNKSLGSVSKKELTVEERGDGYLMRYIKQLEDQNSKLNEDLTKALDTIRELVGKSDSVHVAGFVPYIFLTFIYKSMYTLYP